MAKVIIPPCAEIQVMSEKGIAFLIKEEGIKLKPYLDKAKVATIGIGSTYYENGVRVTMTDKAITKDRAISLFRNILKIYERAVWSSTRDDINQNQFDSLTSFTYNIGVANLKISTLLKLVNKDKQDPAIAAEFKKWKYADGEPCLLERRIRESELYFKV